MAAEVHKKMRNTICLVLMFSTFAATVRAATDSLTAPPHSYIESGYGLGYATFVDNGTSPLRYRGVSASLTVGFARRWNTWQGAARLTLGGGLYGTQPIFKFKYNTCGGAVGLEVMALHRLWQQGRWSLWAGAAVADMAELRYNPNLNNSSTTVDNFVVPQICGRAELELRRWLFSATFGVAPLTVAYRPGYAFIGNYNSVNHDVTLFTDGYRWLASPLGFASAAVGATLKLKGGNTLALDYRELFCRSTNASDYRMAIVSRMLVLTFNYILD